MSNSCAFAHSVATISSNREEQLPLAEKSWGDSLNSKVIDLTEEVGSPNKLAYSLSNLLKDKSYIPFTLCVLEHILTSPELSHHEKLYYLLADSLALINANSKNSDSRRAVALPADSWAQKLNCSKAQVFSMQKSLKDKGYFVIAKNHNKFGQNMRNLIMPTLPDNIFEDLNKSAPTRKGEFSFFDQNKECKRSYLDKTKLFVGINYQLLALILVDASLNNFQKIVWLDLFISSLQAKQSNITISYKEIADKYLVNQKLISKTVISLQKLGFLKRSQAFIKRESLLEARQDKVLWNIFVTLPDNYLRALMESDDRSSLNVNCDINTESALDPLVLKDQEQQGSISDPHFANFRPLLNKDFKINNFKDRSIKSNFCKNYFEKNFQQKNKFQESRAVNADQIKDIFSKAKELKDFYPISHEDCQNLQSSSKREFSLNAMNEILLDMSKRLADRVFYSKKGFMSYMSKVFAWEKRDAVKTSNESFKIKNNHTAEETSLKEKEEFLTEIEYNLQVSPEWHLKKKLACVFDTEKSYELLNAYKSSSRAGYVFEIHLNRHVDLTNLDREIILSQVKATHEKIDFDDEEFGLIEKLEIIMPDNPCQKQLRKGFNDKEITKLPDNIWGMVRQNLISKYGEAIDKHWFSKLDAMVDEDRKIIELKSPSGFVHDWIKQNYFTTIENMLEQEKYQVMFD